MRRLGPRPVADPAELTAVMAERLPHLETGPRLLDRDASAGEVTVDIAAVDGGGRLALILCDIEARPPVRGLDAQRAAVLIERLERLRFSEGFR